MSLTFKCSLLPVSPLSDDEKSEDSDAPPPHPISALPKTIMYGDVGFYALGTLGMLLSSSLIL